MPKQVDSSILLITRGNKRYNSVIITLIKTANKTMIGHKNVLKIKAHFCSL